MIIDSIASALDALQENVSFPLEAGEDYPLLESENERQVMESTYRYLAERNEARKVAECVTWDGLLQEAGAKAQAQAEPTQKFDALLELAAVALAFAGSVSRQTEGFNEEKPKGKAVK